jgi:hypothetical protein
LGCFFLSSHHPIVNVFSLPLFVFLATHPALLPSGDAKPVVADFYYPFLRLKLDQNDRFVVLVGLDEGTDFLCACW